jgi:hypothetical protein
MPRRQCAPSPPKAQQNDVEPPLRNDVVALDRGLEDMIWRIVSRFSELASRPLAVPNDVARAFFDGMFQQALLKLLAGGGRPPRTFRPTSRPRSTAWFLLGQAEQAVPDVGKGLQQLPTSVDSASYPSRPSRRRRMLADSLAREYAPL